MMCGTRLPQLTLADACALVAEEKAKRARRCATARQLAEARRDLAASLERSRERTGRPRTAPIAVGAKLHGQPPRRGVA